MNAFQKVIADQIRKKITRAYLDGMLEGAEVTLSLLLGKKVEDAPVQQMPPPLTGEVRVWVEAALTNVKKQKEER